MLSGALLALAGIVRKALAAPAVLGEKATVTEHVCLGASNVQLLLDTEKGGPPGTVGVPMLMEPSPSVFAVLLSVIAICLLEFTRTVPKLAGAGSAPNAGFTCGVGVGAGVGVAVLVGVGVGAVVGVAVGVGAPVGVLVGVPVGVAVGAVADQLHKICPAGTAIPSAMEQVHV